MDLEPLAEISRRSWIRQGELLRSFYGRRLEATETAKQQDGAMVQVELEMTALAKQKDFVQRERE